MTQLGINKKLRWFCVVFCVGFAIAPMLALAVSDDTDVSLDVIGCNNNSICEPLLGENYLRCPHDCTIAALRSGEREGETDIRPPNLYNLLVVSSQFSASIRWQTYEPTISKVFWGKTGDYEGGVIAEIDYATNHSTLLDNLKPDTLYHFKIEAQDKSHNKIITQDRTFRTLALPDEIPPANVSELEAEEKEEAIELFWQNPPDPDFEKVRIVKNKEFYPKDPYDGEIVYEGPGKSFIDKDLFDEDYYYTVFAYDKSGNFSSGAIIKARPKAAPAPPALPAGRPKPPKPPLKPPIIPRELEEISLMDIKFIQDGKILVPKDGNILADTGKPMKVSIDYDKLPEVLKTIILSLERCDDERVVNRESSFAETCLPSGKGYGRTQSLIVNRSEPVSCQNPRFFSFLLRVNQAKTEYAATILAPQEAGIYPILVSILDFQNQHLKELQGKLLLRQKFVPVEEEEENAWMIIGRVITLMTGLVILVLAGYMIYWMFAKWRRVSTLNRHETVR